MTDWVRAAATDDLAPDSVIGVVVGDRKIALYDVGGELYATDDICSHGQARLSDGYFDPDSCSIECPLHAGIFDVATGEPLEGPVTMPMATYPVKREGDAIMIELD